MTVLESVVGAEGRVSLPAAVRKQLGLQRGGTVSWVLGEDGQYRLTTAQALAEALWASADSTSTDSMSSGSGEGIVREQREAEETRTRHTEPADWAGARTNDAAVLALLGEEA
jgi:bifunctional DNA-binding transcriptional regulator/antitoxin component of YhaV-PrlF toxin-antitoxin module